MTFHQKLLLLITLLVAPIMVRSAEIGYGVRASVGIANLPEPITEVFDVGYGAGGHFDIGVTPEFALRITAQFLTLSPDNDAIKKFFVVTPPVILVGGGTSATSTSIQGGDISVLRFASEGKFSISPASSISPYAIGGIGIASYSGSDITVTSAGTGQKSTVRGLKKQTRVLFGFGAGMDFQLSPFTLFSEIHPIWVLTDEGTSSFVALTIGVTF